MDAGFMDAEGFLYIMSRSDDVINVAGHRLSSGALEEVALLPLMLFYTSQCLMCYLTVLKRRILIYLFTNDVF